ncbi:MAG: hypothetical protein UZ14_CFX002002023 [Chloroflexi bacterium OLB14]|nr:MAG: hypothetical protein UZ14_CFX002002023 [Chloroflexi bacterium OLB14]
MRTMSKTRLLGFRFLLAVVIAMSMVFIVTPVEACGCGIYIPLDGEASVSEELVLIRWDGQTEDIIVTLGVLGGSSEAAVIFPVPAQADVKLADAEIFDALQELTKPITKKRIALLPVLLAGAPPDSAVTLLSRQKLGPFDVSTLAATDADALSNWLAENGYNLAPEVTAALEPYVQMNWYYVAVRLSPEAGSNELTGELDPLWITFDYDKIIYPMRLSALARDSLTVFMYVLADHRVQKPMSFGYEDVQFADWVEPASLESDSPLAPFITKKMFLTKIVEQIYQPETITNDYIFEFATTDETFHLVNYQYIYDIGGIPFFFLIPAGILLMLFILVIGGIWIIVKLIRKYA